MNWQTRRVHHGKRDYPLPERSPDAQRKHQRVLHRYLILESTSLPNPHVSHWIRRNGAWRCEDSLKPFEWFTGVRHPDLVEQYLRTHKFSWQWKLPTPVDKDSSRPAESRPAEAYPPIQASAPQGDNTAPHKTEQTTGILSPDAKVTGGLQRNGVVTSSPLNGPAGAGDCQSSR